MPKYKRNHYISQGLIHFWKHPNGKVTLWDRSSSGSLALRNPKSVHYEDYLYARWDTEGNRDMNAEHSLKSEIDDHAPKVIQELVDCWPNAVPLKEPNRSFLIKLAVRTVFRHPSIPNLAKRSFKVWVGMLLFRLSRRLERKSHEDGAYEKYGKKRVLHNEIQSHAATMDIDSILETLSHHTIGLLTIAEGSPNFVLGSQSFTLHPHAPETDMWLGLVIHPRIMLGFFKEPKDDFLMVLETDDVLRINGFIIRQSNQVVMVNSQDIEGAWYQEFDKRGNAEKMFVSLRKTD